MLYWEGGVASSGNRIFVHEVGAEQGQIVFEAGESTEVRFSPDAGHVVFHRPESDRDEVFVIEVATGAISQVSTAGGRDPRWSKDGREILFIDLERNVMRIEVTDDGGGLRLGRPQELFQIDANVVAWDAASDHERFLVAARPGLESPPLHVILGWNRDL